MDFAVSTKGVTLRFSDPLDPKTAGDVANITAERWNYFYSGAYGSADYSVTRPKQPQRDTLDIADMRKSHQIQLNLKLHTPDGTSVEPVIYLTVPILGQP